MEIRDIENALIRGGGKTIREKPSVLDAIRAVNGFITKYRERDFNEKKQRVEISMSLSISREDCRCSTIMGV